MATRPRDSQRARLYRAENELDAGRPLPTVPAMQAYVDGVAASGWFLDRWGARSFLVRPGHGHQRATADGHGVLQMPRWARRELVLLHELAHCLAPESAAAHGPEYAGVLVALVRRAMGLGPAQALEDAFDRHRVRWSAAPGVSRASTARRAGDQPAPEPLPALGRGEPTHGRARRAQPSPSAATAAK